MTVTLIEIVAAARAHVAPLAAESAGYLMLGVADLVVSLPRPLDLENVELMADGSVRLSALRGNSEESPERAVRRLLADVLEVASSVGPALRRAAERPEDAGLDILVRELETALIPVNRSAARRALSRLHRETERARQSGRLSIPAPAAAPQPVARAAAPVVAAPVAVPARPLEPEDDVELAIEVVLNAEPSAAAPVAVALPQVTARPPLPQPAPPSVPEAASDVASVASEAVPAVGSSEVFTKPEPVVSRARERRNLTPKLGTLAPSLSVEIAQIVDDVERTDQAPAVEFDDESMPAPAVHAAALVPDILGDPEPSRLPDVVSAMVELRTGLDPDSAPTRLRDVVTFVPESSEFRLAAGAERQDDDESTRLRDVVTAEDEPTRLRAAAAVVQAPLAAGDSVDVDFDVELEPLVGEQAPSALDDEWVDVGSSLDGVETSVHEALTWCPGEVESVSASAVPLVSRPAVEPPSVREPSPFVAAALSTRSSDVSELASAFNVTGAASERELRSALKEMAGLELTPMPLAHVVGED